MDRISCILIVILMGGLSACDSKKLNKPHTEHRTMIIGGQPVFDRDYKMVMTQSVNK